MFKPIKSRTQNLQQQIVSVIREEIIKGSMKPGDQLPSERQLAENLGVSRTSLREALKLIESVGIITIKHGVGAFVNQVDTDTTVLNIAKQVIVDEQELRDLFVLRRIIEPKAAALAACSATEQDLEQLNQFINDTKEILTIREPGYILSYARQQSKFHLLIAKATGNSFIIEIVNTLVELFKNNRVKSLIVDERLPNSLKEHTAIVEAIIAKDSKAAEMAMKEHLSNYQKTAFGQDNDCI